MRLLCALFALVLSLGLAPSRADAQERILSYDVEVVVERSGDLLVREIIDVVAEGREIRRGIYRDFPTRHVNEDGLSVFVTFDVLEVRHNGRPSPHHIVKYADYHRLYIGAEGTLIDRGQHRYEIRYRTAHQLAFLEDHDELYYNLIGHHWVFPIENARASVLLPEGASPMRAEAFTGRRGSQAQDYQLEREGNRLTFRTTRTLSPEQGMTAVITWQKGLVAAPSDDERLNKLIYDNLGTVVGGLGLIGLALYYLFTWWKVGRDPKRGVIFPRFSAPHGLSPVALGYIYNQGFRRHMEGSEPFTIALISLATKGYIEIVEEGAREYTLIRTAKEPENLPPAENAILHHLFLAMQKDSIKLGAKFDPVVNLAKSYAIAAVEAEYSQDYFRHNRGHWAFGVLWALLIGLAVVLLNVPLSEDTILAGVMVAIFSGFSLAIYAMVRAMIFSLTRGSIIKLFLKLLFSLFLTLLFVVPMAIFAQVVVDVLTFPAIAIVAASLILVCTFFSLMEAPTQMGRKVMDEIEGYMMFLSTTEWDRMRLSGFNETPSEALFEKHLPYSMALGMQTQWTRAFGALAASAGMKPESYQPRWYRGYRGGAIGMGALTQGLSSGLSSTVSAASSPPSSSGSGGGGSSGGGGGGGGGGGW